MKIAKRSKKPLSPHAGVNALILSVQDVPDDELPAVLDAVQHWHWPRTDLHYWIKPLNRFDSILEEISKSYGIGGSNGDSIQMNEFTPRTKALVLAILRFTRLLLENATNRKLYASFDRMNDFLLTIDLDVLEGVLRLIFRRAQQVASNGQIHQAETFNLTPDRVKDLTKGWKTLQQTSGLSMHELVKEDPALATKLASMQDVSFQFYRKAASPAAGQAKALPEMPSGEGIAMTPMATPAPRSGRTFARSNTATSATGLLSQPVTPSTGKQPASSSETDAEGMTTVNLGNVTESGKSATNLLEDAVELYRIPKEERLHLLQRIRCALSAQDVDKRRQMLRIKMLAVSVLILTTGESQAEASVFMFQPTFVQQVADLVHPNNHIPMNVRTTALFCLDTVSRVRNHVGEVTASLSVNVNHGTLMSILRKLITDLHAEKPEATTEYIDALFNFLMHLQTTGFAGNMLLGAGIVPLLVDIVKETPPTRADTVDSLIAANRSVSFLDNFTYSFASAAAPFSTANGLQVFVARVHQLVKRGVEQRTTQDAEMQVEGKRADQDILSYPESTLLKSLFRCLQRLMGSGGNAEGVRNLIDSSLVESCRLVMQHRKVFGPQNMALAINIMLTFVHNEPTSLTILQENKIPDAFYDAIESEIEPSLDVLSAIPTAIGALCLNEAGLKQFLDSRLSIIKKFFEVFQSEPHARVLNERENAVVIGANFDELVRHHPDLKQPVFDAITGILKALYEQGKDYVPENAEGYRLVQVSEASAAKQEKLEQARSSEAASIIGDASMGESAPSSSAASKAVGEQSEESTEDKKEDNKMLTFIAVTGRFLEGFFSTPNHCKEYFRRDGFDALLKLFTLPCIPFDLTHHSPYPGLTTVFLSINENASHGLLKALLGQVKSSLADIKTFWKSENTDEYPIDVSQLSSRLSEMLQPDTPEALASANTLFRGIVRAQLVVTILSELYSLESYVSRQPGTQLLSTLRSSEELKAIHELCALQRACVLANVKLKSSMPASAKPATPFGAISDKAIETPALEAAETEPIMQVSSAGDAAQANSAEERKEWPESKLKNAKALKTVLSTIPDSLRYFFQGIMTVQTARRSNVDSQQRRDATYVANAIATGMAQSLRWPGVGDADTSINFDYAAIMVKFMADLLHSDRSSTAGLHLIFLKALDKQSGMDRLVDLYRRYVEEASRLTEVAEGDRDDSTKLRLVHAIGGLKVVLGVFQTLTSHKSLLPPGHLLMLTQDKQSSSYFDPHNFLVKLRSKILPAILKVWNSELLGPCPPIIVRAVFRILLHILEGQGETSPAEGSSAAPPFMGAMPARQPVVPSPTLVTTLIDMGFPRTACETALTRRNNNLQAAADWLMSHPEVVSAARTREAAEAAQGEGADGEGDAADPAVGDAADAPAGNLEVPTADAGAAPRPATPADIDMTDAASGSNTPVPPVDEAPATAPEKSKSRKYSREELSSQRDAVKTTFISRALALSQDHAELVFDIKDALKTVTFPLESGGWDTTSGLDSIFKGLNDILEQGVPETSDGERSVAARVRLIAIMFADSGFRRSSDATYMQAVGPVNVLLNEYMRQKYEAEKRPKWLSSVLLLAELLLAKTEVPTDANISSATADSADATKSSITKGPALHEERSLLLTVCLDVLSKSVKEIGIYQSCMRLLNLLTRQYDMAAEFVKQGGLPLLVRTHDGTRKDHENFQAYAAMILRNTVESSSIVRGLVEKHIDTWLSKPRRSQDVGAFARDLAASIGRDPALFLQVVESMCMLGPNDMLMRKKEDKEESTSVPAEGGSAVNDPAAGAPQPVKEISMQIDDLSKSLPSLGVPSEQVETVMHFLLAEAMEASNAVLKATQSPQTNTTDGAKTLPSDTAPAQPGSTEPIHNDQGDASANTASPKKKDETMSQSLKDYTYSAFLLKVIGELIASYVPCKLALLSYSKRKQEAAPGAPSGLGSTHKSGKQKSQFLSYVINEHLSTGALVMNKTLESRKRFALSTQAIGLIINLCNDPIRSHADKEESSSDITTVRKAVLDAIAKSFKDANSGKEAVGAKYGKIAGLSHVCSRLLAPPLATGGPGPQKASSELSLHMAKLMLEKNFAVILTNALADIDLNYPGVQTLINALLSPLEHLTKLVTKIGKPVDQAAIPSAVTAEAIVPALDEFQAAEDAESDEDASMGEHMDQDDIAEEIDPDEPDDGEGADVFRNSALGMFGGELEPAMAEDQYSEEEMDEQMEEWDDGEDDMMDEEGVVPSDVSDTSEGEDDEMEMAGEIRDGLDDEDDGMGTSDDDEDSQDEDDDPDGEGHEIIDGDDDDGPVDLQADITAALQNGQLEPVDDFTNRLINEGMDLLGEPGEDGMIEVGPGGPWDQGGPGPHGDEDDDDLEGDGIQDGDGFDEDEDPDDMDEEEDDDGGEGPPGTFDVNEMFRDLVGGGQGAGPVQLAIMGGPPGEEQPILSVDLGNNPSGLGLGRRTLTAPRTGTAPALAPHALLVDETDTGRHRSRGEFVGSSRSSRRNGRHGTEYQEWLSSIEDMIGSGAGQLLEQVFGNIQGGPAGGAPQLPAGGMGGAGAILQNLITSMSNRGGHSSRHRQSVHHSRTENATTSEMQIVNETISHPGWVPNSTVDRWMEASVVFSGGMQAPERFNLYAKRITAILTPEKQRRQKEQDEKDAKEKEERIKEMEKAMAEQAAQEAEETAQREREEAEAAAAGQSNSEESGSTSAAQEQVHAESTMELDSAPPVAPETPAAATTSAATTAGSSDRPNWRERVARRRQEQAAAAAAQQPSLSTSDELARVLALANSFAAGASASENSSNGGQTEAVPPASAAMEPTHAPAATEDSEMIDEQPAAEEAAEETGEQMTDANVEEEPEAGPSTAAAPSERITIQIRGNTVDITDTGIDPTFLEALPDDMREEVLNQHFRESRAAAAVAAVPQDVATTISSEFLDALPPEMRAEVLAQEALERARRRQQEQQQAAASGSRNSGDSAASAPAEGAAVAAEATEDGQAAAGPVEGAASAGNAAMMDLDPAAFLATLDPQLREVVLLEQGEEMLDVLPPDLRAEYETLVARERRAMAGLRRPFGGRAPAAGGYSSMLAGASSRRAAAPATPPVPIKREAVQLLDKSGVATLIRLLFFPHPLKKMGLQSILIHLCENTKTRIDLLNLLLTILHDGTKDGGAGGAVVDKTFSQMSLSKVGSGRPVSKGKGSTTSQAPVTPSSATATTSAAASIPGLPFSLVSGGPGDNIPNLVVQRSLEALAYLVASNEASANFFLTEQELQLNLAKEGKKVPGTGKRDKGKGRASEAAPQQNTKVYPIIVLLSLLDRESLSKTSSIMEALTKLLAHITIPLRHLEQNQKRLAEEQKANEKAASAEKKEGSDVPATTTKDLTIQKAVEENRLLVKPPQIPVNYLKMVVNILDLGECSSKMFSAALGLINNIWLLPEARTIVSSELIVLAQKYGKNLIADLAELETALDSSADSAMAVDDTTDQRIMLSKFSQASSNQAKILRVLKTIEHAKQQQAKLQKKRADEAEAKKKAEESAKKLVEALKNKEGEDAQASSSSGPTDAAKADEVQATEKSEEQVVEEVDRNKVDELYDGFDFSPLWTKLSDCLAIIEKSEDVSNAGTLLPLIEAFLLVSSWGIEGTDALSQETPAMLPANMFSPVVQPAII